MKYSNKFYKQIKEWLYLGYDFEIDPEGFDYVLDRWYTTYHQDVLRLKFEEGYSTVQVAEKYGKVSVTILKLVQRMEGSLRRFKVLFDKKVTQEEREEYLIYYLDDVLYEKDLKVLHALGYEKITEFSRGVLYEVRGAVTQKTFRGLKELLTMKGLYKGLNARIAEDYPNNLLKAIGIPIKDVSMVDFDGVLYEMSKNEKLAKEYASGLARFKDCMVLEDIAKLVLGGMTREAARIKVDDFVDYLRKRRLEYDLMFVYGSEELLSEEFGAKYTKVLGSKRVLQLKEHGYYTLDDLLGANIEDLKAIDGLGKRKLELLIENVGLLGFELNKGRFEIKEGCTGIGSTRLSYRLERFVETLMATLRFNDVKKVSGAVQFLNGYLEVSGGFLTVKYFTDVASEDGLEVVFSMVTSKILSIKVLSSGTYAYVGDESELDYVLVKSVVRGVLGKYIGKIKINHVKTSGGCYFSVIDNGEVKRCG